MKREDFLKALADMSTGGPGSHPGGTHRKKGLARDGGPDGDVPGNDAEDEGKMLLATQGPE